MNSNYTYFDMDSEILSGRLDYRYLKANIPIESSLEIVKIKDIILDYQLGKTVKNAPYSYNGDIPFIKVDNFIQDEVKLTSSTKYLRQEDFNRFYGSNVCHKGDVLISIVASIGKIAKNNLCDCMTNQQIVSLTLNENIIDKDYFVYIIKCKFMQDRLDGLKKISATPNMNTTDLLNFKIPLISLEEQRRTLPLIQGKIKIINEKINQLEKEKENNSLKNVIDRAFYEVLGIKKPIHMINFYNHLVSESSVIYSANIDDLNNCLDFLTNTHYNIQNDLKEKYSVVKLNDLLQFPPCNGSSTKKSTIESNYYRIMVKNLSSYNEKMKILDLDYITEEDYTNCDNDKKLKHGDILYSSCGGGCLGNMVVNDTDLSAIIDTHVGFMRLIDESSSMFIYYYLTSYLGQQQLFRCITGTTNQIMINPKKMGKILVPVLDDSIIKLIITKIEKYKGNKPIIERQIKKLMDYKNEELNKYILNGYSDSLFALLKEDAK